MHDLTIEEASMNPRAESFGTADGKGVKGSSPPAPFAKASADKEEEGEKTPVLCWFSGSGVTVFGVFTVTLTVVPANVCRV
jgi:hypothetical protein